MARDSDWGKRKVAKVYDSANRRAQRRKEGMRTEDRSQREAGVARVCLCSPLPVPACLFPSASSRLRAFAFLLMDARSYPDAHSRSNTGERSARAGVLVSPCKPMGAPSRTISVMPVSSTPRRASCQSPIPFAGYRMYSRRWRRTCTSGDARIRYRLRILSTSTTSPGPLTKAMPGTTQGFCPGTTSTAWKTPALCERRTATYSSAHTDAGSSRRRPRRRSETNCRLSCSRIPTPGP